MHGLDCVKGEIHNVLAVLRVSGRSLRGLDGSYSGGSGAASLFGFGGFSRRDEHIETLRYKLCAAFKELQGFLGYYSELQDIDTVTLLRPFNDLLLSDIKGVDVMNTDLSAILKFLQYSLINEESPSVASALHELLNAVCNATFDCHSRDDIELMHIRSMEVLLEILHNPAGFMLSDDDVCRLIQKVFDIRYFHIRESGGRNDTLMRRYTENVLAQMVMLVYSQLVEDDLILADYQLMKHSERQRRQKQRQSRGVTGQTSSSADPKGPPLSSVTAVVDHPPSSSSVSTVAVSSRKKSRLPSSQLAKATDFRRDADRRRDSVSSMVRKRLANQSFIHPATAMRRGGNGSAFRRRVKLQQHRTQQRMAKHLKKPSKKLGGSLSSKKTTVLGVPNERSTDTWSDDSDEDTMDTGAGLEMLNGIRPFGIPCMVRIFKYLLHLINPNYAENTADVREFGLRLINILLETSGQFLNNHPELIGIIQDELCRQLLSNSQSQHFGILSLVLRIIFDLFSNCKEKLRVQLEVFFMSIHLRIVGYVPTDDLSFTEDDLAGGPSGSGGSSSAAPAKVSAGSVGGVSSTYEQRELVLESLVEFTREPDLIVGLYTNYDCRVGSTHLFEDLVKFLSEQAMPGLRRRLSGGSPSHGGSGASSSSAAVRRRVVTAGVGGVIKGNIDELNDLHLIAAEGILAIIDCIARKFLSSKKYRRMLAASNVAHSATPVASSGSAAESKVDIAAAEEDTTSVDDGGIVRLSSDSVFSSTESVVGGSTMDDAALEAELEEIRRQQKLKHRLKVAAKHFNAKLEKSLDYLQQLGQLDTPLTAKSVASFLHSNTYLNKMQIGQFFAKNKPFNLEVLHEYVYGHYLEPFRWMTIDEAIRLFLESFHLRGEAEQVARIIEKFANCYFESQQIVVPATSSSSSPDSTADASPAALHSASSPSSSSDATVGDDNAAEKSGESDQPATKKINNCPIADEDACFILSFSIIQLNTDAHNDQVINKMTFEGYKKNVRGMNGKDENGKYQDFDERFLWHIYRSITMNEIKNRSNNPRDIFVSSPGEHGYGELEMYDHHQNGGGYYHASNAADARSLESYGNGSVGYDSDSNESSSTDSYYHVPPSPKASPVESEIEHVVSSALGAGGGSGGGPLPPSGAMAASSSSGMTRSVSHGSSGSGGIPHSSPVPGSAGGSGSPGSGLPSGGGSSLYDVKRSEWTRVLKKAQRFGKFSTVAPHSTGNDMFGILWEPALRILEFHLRYAGHPKVLDRIAQGLTTLAKISHCYQVKSAFNSIVHSICNNLMSNLLQFGQLHELLPHSFDASVSVAGTVRGAPSLGSSSSRTASEVVGIPYFLSAPEDDRQWSSSAESKRMTALATDESMLQLELALDIRIVFVMKMYFTLVRNFGGFLLTDGWSSVNKILLWLLHLDLIPHELFGMEDFTDSKGQSLPSIFDEMIGRSDSAVKTPADEPSLTSWISSTWNALFSMPTDESTAAMASTSSRVGSSSSAASASSSSTAARVNGGRRYHSADDMNDRLLQVSSSPGSALRRHSLLEGIPSSQAKQQLAGLSSEDYQRSSEYPDSGIPHLDSPMDPAVQQQHPGNAKCQYITNELKTCELNEIYAESKHYHINSLTHLIRSLIALSSIGSSDAGTSASSSLGETVTSLDPNPMDTRTLIELASKTDEPTSQTDELLRAAGPQSATDKMNDTDIITQSTDGLDDELESVQARNRRAAMRMRRSLNEDVICMPLTLEMKVFCLERLGQVVIANMERLTDIWAPVYRHYLCLIQAFSDGSVEPNFLFERVVVHILRLCSFLCDVSDSSIRREVSSLIGSLSALDDYALFAVGRRVVAGLSLFLSMEAEASPAEDNGSTTEDRSSLKTALRSHQRGSVSIKCLTSESEWRKVLLLLQRFAVCEDRLCCLEAFQLIESVSSTGHLSAMNFGALLHVLQTYPSSGIGAVDGSRVVRVVYEMQRKLDDTSVMDVGLSHRCQLWHKTCSVIARFAANREFHTRRTAVQCLKKCLLTEPLSFVGVEHWSIFFDSRLNPLLLQVTQLENDRIEAHLSRVSETARVSGAVPLAVHSPLMTAGGSSGGVGTGSAMTSGVSSSSSAVMADSSGNKGGSSESESEDLRLQLLTIVFRVFNHRVELMRTQPNFEDMWYRFITCVRQFLLMVANNESLVTHCTEWLRNAILVAKSTGFFEESERGEMCWQKTWQILVQVTPELQSQISESVDTVAAIAAASDGTA